MALSKEDLEFRRACTEMRTLSDDALKRLKMDTAFTLGLKTELEEYDDHFFKMKSLYAKIRKELRKREKM